MLKAFMKSKIYLIEIDVELKIYENGNLKNTKIFKTVFYIKMAYRQFFIKIRL